jgi:hypothetical protein
MRRGREKRRVSVETARGEKEKKLVYKSQQGGGMNPGKKIPGPRRERPPDRRWEMSSAHKLVLKKREKLRAAPKNHLTRAKEAEKFIGCNPSS